MYMVTAINDNCLLVSVITQSCYALTAVGQLPTASLLPVLSTRDFRGRPDIYFSQHSSSTEEVSLKTPPGLRWTHYILGVEKRVTPSYEFLEGSHPCCLDELPVLVSR
jgi:hypothetical protein